MKVLLMALALTCAAINLSRADSPRMVELYKLHADIDSTFAIVSLSNKEDVLQPLIDQLDQAGNSIISTDVGLKPDEKMVVQNFAYSCFSKESTLLLRIGKAEIVKKLADKQLATLWLEGDGLPKSGAITVDGKTVHIMLSNLYKFRKAFFRDAAQAAVLTEDFDAILKYGKLYDRFNAYPSTYADEMAYINKLSNHREMLGVHLKMYEPDAIKNQLYNIFKFLQNHNSSLSADREFTINLLKEIDEMLLEGEITYAEIDNGGALQASMGDTYLMLFNNEKAFSMYEGAIRSGNRSTKVFINKLLAATQTGDRELVKISLDDLKDIPKNSMTDTDQTVVRDISLQFKALE